MLFSLPELVAKHQLNIKGILHLGAHTCEEASTYSQLNIQNVIWCEANPVLVEQQRQLGHNVYQILLSDENDQIVDFFVTNNGQSSSMLPLDKHKLFYPQITVSQVLRLPSKRLDTFITEQKWDMSLYNMLNLDLQGAELKALKGLGTFLNAFDVVYTEVNVDTLYKDCALLHELDAYLKTFGFHRKETQMTFANWGDALYLHDRVLTQTNKVRFFRPLEDNVPPEFYLDTTWFTTLPEQGITFLIRAKNEEKTIETAISSITERLQIKYNIVVVVNDSTDKTLEIATRSIDSHTRNDEVVVYPYKLAKPGLENYVTPANSIHSFVYFSQFCLMKCSRQFVFRWDADFEMTDELADELHKLFSEPHTLMYDCISISALDDDAITNTEKYIQNRKALLCFYKYQMWEVLGHWTACEKKYHEIPKNKAFIRHNSSLTNVKTYLKEKPWWEELESHSNPSVEKVAQQSLQEYNKWITKLPPHLQLFCRASDEKCHQICWICPPIEEQLQIGLWVRGLKSQ